MYVYIYIYIFGHNTGYFSFKGVGLQDLDRTRPYGTNKHNTY